MLLDQSDSTQFNADYGKVSAKLHFVTLFHINTHTLHDYSVPRLSPPLPTLQALGLSFLFYEAQRSGKLPPTNRIPWRGDSHLSDCIVGGYHDAGDHLKLAFPLSTSLAFLALGVTEFGDAYSAAGQLNWALDAIRWGTDFLVAAHSSPNEFVGQIGDPGIDHAYWGRPEQQTGARPCFVWNSSTPASDLLGAAASGLAAGSMAFQQSDSSYAQTLLSHAQQLYSMATASEGKYSDTYSSATYVYSSGSFRDDLALAAALLWKATGNQTYLHDAVAQRSKSDFAELSFLDWDSGG